MLPFAAGETWCMSSSSDLRALAVVDGLGRFQEFGPHYSRRTPGSVTFTGIGQELVLVSEDGSAVWSVVRQKTPSRPGSGASRGRGGTPDESPVFVWRNTVFRNLGTRISSLLIVEATKITRDYWPRVYGTEPMERLRTEVEISKVQSTNPGYCYICAGWERGPLRRGKLIMYAPPLPTTE